MSTPANNTTVSIAATLEVNGRQVTVNTQDVKQLAKGNIVFSISDPVDIGTPHDFCDWLHTTLHLDKGDFDIDNFESYLPSSLHTAWEDFLGGHIILTVLSIDQPNKSYQFAVVFELADPLAFPGVGDFLKLDSIGLSVQEGPVL